MTYIATPDSEATRAVRAPTEPESESALGSGGPQSESPSRFFLIITAAMCASAFSPGFRINPITRSIPLQNSNEYSKLFVKGKAAKAGIHNTLAQSPKTCSERDAKNSMDIQNKMKMRNILSDLDFGICSELGDKTILPTLPATTVANRLAVDIAGWAHIMKFDNYDALRARRMAPLLVQYNKKCPNTEFQPLRRNSQSAGTLDTKAPTAMLYNLISQSIAGTIDSSVTRMFSRCLIIFLSSMAIQVAVLPQLHTITGMSALTQSSSAGAEVMMDEFFNKWTRGPGISGVWTDEQGGTTFHSPAYIRIHTLHTTDGRIWSLRAGVYWTNARGELRRFRPAPSSEEWRSAFFPVWESSDGETTREWPSKRRPPLSTPTGDAPETHIDSFFHVWTRAASGGWVDEYGGRTDGKDAPDYQFEMRTADGKAWLWRDETLWVSRGGECQRQPPRLAIVRGWRQQRVAAWTSSDGDVRLGWPSKALQERQGGAAAT